MSDRRPVQIKAPTLDEFGEFQRMLVIYEGDREKEIKFNSLDELERDLEVDLDRLRRAVIWRKTPDQLKENFRTTVQTGTINEPSPFLLLAHGGQVIYGLPLYEEVPHAEKLLMQTQKRYYDDKTAALKAQTKAQKEEKNTATKPVEPPEPEPIKKEPKTTLPVKEKPEPINPASIAYQGKRYLMPVVQDKKDTILFPNGSEIVSSSLGQPIRIYSQEASTGSIKIKPLEQILTAAQACNTNLIAAKKVNSRGLFEFRCYTHPTNDDVLVKQYGVEAMLSSLRQPASPQSSSP